MPALARPPAYSKAQSQSWLTSQVRPHYSVRNMRCTASWRFCTGCGRAVDSFCAAYGARGRPCLAALLCAHPAPAALASVFVLRLHRAARRTPQPPKTPSRKYLCGAACARCRGCINCSGLAFGSSRLRSPPPPPTPVDFSQQQAGAASCRLAHCQRMIGSSREGGRGGGAAKSHPTPFGNPPTKP